MKISSFQERVYAALRHVPSGAVTTYALLAKAIGSPRAVRAVGTALKNNPYAPEVPCHRVIRSDGRLGHYNRGQKKKRALLVSEGILLEGDRVLTPPLAAPVENAS